MEDRTSHILLIGSKYFDGIDFEIYRLLFVLNENKDAIKLAVKEGPFVGEGIGRVIAPDNEVEMIYDEIQAYLNHPPQGLTVSEIAQKGIELGVARSLSDFPSKWLISLDVKFRAEKIEPC
jgi:hypothetical protein